MRYFYKRAAKHAHCVFFQNSDDMNYFKEHGLLSKDNAHVVSGSGVDTKHFKQTPLPDKPVFLMTARLLWSKGIREYLQAAKQLVKACPEAQILLVGGLDHNDEAITEEELNTAIKESNIEYCGHSDDVREYLDKCSVFVLPSYHEGMPRSVLEAMSVGRPIITTDVPGCREAVKHEVNGLVVPVQDSEELFKAMLALAKDKVKRARFAKESRKMAETIFDVDVVNKNIIMYMQL